MSRRTAAWLAWSICALSLGLSGFSLLVLIRIWSHPNIHVFDYWVEHRMVAVVFSTVCAVRASRCPDRPVGWLFCMVGFVGEARHLLLSPGEQRSRAIRRYEKILSSHLPQQILV
jgi:hypothetical protein